MEKTIVSIIKVVVVVITGIVLFFFPLGVRDFIRDPSALSSLLLLLHLIVIVLLTCLCAVTLTIKKERDMTITFDIELTSEGHKMYVSNENYPVRKNGAADPQLYKGIHLLAFEHLAHELLIPSDDSETELSKMFCEWLEQRKQKYGVK